jgi:hypothetical protein
MAAFARLRGLCGELGSATAAQPDGAAHTALAGGCGGGAEFSLPKLSRFVVHASSSLPMPVAPRSSGGNAVHRSGVSFTTGRGVSWTRMVAACRPATCIEVRGDSGTMAPSGDATLSRSDSMSRSGEGVLAAYTTRGAANIGAAGLAAILFELWSFGKIVIIE